MKFVAAAALGVAVTFRQNVPISAAEFGKGALVRVSIETIARLAKAEGP